MSEHSDPTPFAGDIANYTPAAFADALRTDLASAGIELNLNEDADGTRTVRAWQTTDPETFAVFPVDEIRILPYQVDILATTIRRSFAAPLTAERAPNQPADSGGAEGAPDE